MNDKTMVDIDEVDNGTTPPIVQGTPQYNSDNASDDQSSSTTASIGRKISKRYYANSVEEEPNKVLDIVDEYYKQLLEKLRSHLMLEDVIRDEFAFSTFYNQLCEQLMEKLDKMPVNNTEEYNALLTQAKFHLNRKYNDELFQFHNSKSEMPESVKKYLEFIKERDELFFLKEELGDLLDSLESAFNPISDQNSTRIEKKAENINLSQEIETKEQLALSWWRRIIKTLSTFFPIIEWFPAYRKHLHDLKSDIIAGVTIGAMLIPQGMGYSMIVGNPPIYGLYAALIPLFVYSVMGTSRQLAMGPTALCSIVLAAGLHKLSANPEPGTQLYISFSLLFGLVIGACQMICGILRLGYLVNFMSYPVLSGFTSASAIIILFSQLNYFFGLHMPQDTRVQVSIKYFAESLSEIHVPSMILGFCCLVFLFIFDKGHFSLKREKKIKLFGKEFKLPRHYSLHKIPGVLALVVVAILSMYLVKVIGNFDSSNGKVSGIKIVGKVPSGLPKIGIPEFKQVTAKTSLRELLSICLPIGLVGYLEAISIGKFYALQNGYELDYNQELIAIGASNLLGSWVKVFPGSGSMPRTVVNANSGARTQLAGFISGVCVIATLLFLTPLTYYLPKPALAAIITYSCKKIFNYEHMIFTYKTKKRDFFLLFLAFFCTLFVGIAEGILIGIAASMALVIYRTTRPRFNKLGRVPGTNMYEEVKKSKEVVETPGVLIMRFDADLYFANTTYFRHRIDKMIRKAPWTVYALVIDCSSINQCDSTAVSAFEDLKQLLDKQQIEFYASGMKKSITDVLKKGGAFNVFRKSCFPSLHEAVLRAEYSTRLRIAAKKDQEEKAALLSKSEEYDRTIVDIAVRKQDSQEQLNHTIEIKE